MEEPRGVKSKDLYPPIFSRYASAYARRLEGNMSRGETRGRERLLELLALEPGMRALDVACGPGTLSARIATSIAPNGEVIGVDLAPGMIELARTARIPHASFEVMDMEQLTFPDASFDAAACGHGLQFASDLTRALAEIRRVLKPGARLAASVPVRGLIDPVSAALDEVFDRRLPPAPEAADASAAWEAVSDAARFRGAALAAGFALANVEVIDEEARWHSAEDFVTESASWWSCAARLDGVAPETREACLRDAISAVRATQPGAFTTRRRTHVILAVAPLS